MAFCTRHGRELHDEGAQTKICRCIIRSDVPQKKYVFIFKYMSGERLVALGKKAKKEGEEKDRSGQQCDLAGASRSIVRLAERKVRYFFKDMVRNVHMSSPSITSSKQLILHISYSSVECTPNREGSNVRYPRLEWYVARDLGDSKVKPYKTILCVHRRKARV